MYIKITEQEWIIRKQERQELLAKHKEERKALTAKRRQEKIDHDKQLRDEARWLAFQNDIEDFTGEYKPVPENPKYVACDDGRVYNFQLSKWCKPMKHKLGYQFIGRFIINGKKKFCLLHQVIAHTFIPKPEDKVELDHISGIKTDSSVKNLRWVTRGENIRAAWDLGLMENARLNTNRGNAKLTAEQAEEIRIRKDNGDSVEDMCKEYQVGGTTIYRLLRGETWK